MLSQCFPAQVDLNCWEKLKKKKNHRDSDLIGLGGAQALDSFRNSSVEKQVCEVDISNSMNFTECSVV